VELIAVLLAGRTHPCCVSLAGAGRGGAVELIVGLGCRFISPSRQARPDRSSLRSQPKLRTDRVPQLLDRPSELGFRRQLVAPFLWQPGLRCQPRI
jgi:hypothetical protein